MEIWPNFPNEIEAIIINKLNFTVDVTVLGKSVSYSFLKIFLFKLYLFHFKKMFVIQRMSSSKEEIKLSYCFLDCDPLQLLESRVGWSEIMKIFSSYISGRSSTFLYFYFFVSFIIRHY